MRSQSTLACHRRHLCRFAQSQSRTRSAIADPFALCTYAASRTTRPPHSCFRECTPRILPTTTAAPQSIPPVPRVRRRPAEASTPRPTASPPSPRPHPTQRTHQHGPRDDYEKRENVYVQHLISLQSSPLTWQTTPYAWHEAVRQATQNSSPMCSLSRSILQRLLCAHRQPLVHISPTSAFATRSTIAVSSTFMQPPYSDATLTASAESASASAAAPAPTPLRYRFLFRSRMIGIYEWICPVCGTLNRSSMRATTFSIQCRHLPCRRVWGLGYALHELPAARYRPPDDHLIPRDLVEAFPEGDVGRWWKSGKLANCVHTATGTLAMPEPGSGMGEGEIAPQKR